MRFEEYVAQRRPALMRFAVVLTGQTWLAQDIVSDVLGRAFERWDEIAAMAEPNAYVRRMVVNDYHSRGRRLARTRPAAQLDLGPPVGDGAAEFAERDAMLQRLAKLPRKQRTAIVLRYYEGLPDAQIAEYLGCTPQTVRSQISRALAGLRIDPQPDHLALTHREQT